MKIYSDSSKQKGSPDSSLEVSIARSTRFMTAVRHIGYDSAQERFICEWGTLCTRWGVNKTMGQIHGLLLISPDDLCADEVMSRLSLSRGNVNMNLRALEQWRLVSKVQKIGERKDYYRAEKDLNNIFKIIIAERKKQELDPLITLLKEVDAVHPQCEHSKEFCKVTKEIHHYAQKADHALNAILSSKVDWISRILLR